MSAPTNEPAAIFGGTSAGARQLKTIWDAAPGPTHGTGPAPDEPRLLRREELPAWVKPEKERGRLYAFRSFFYGRPGMPKIRQAMFAIGPGGAVFVDLVIHTPEGKSQLRAGDETALPGCVLIAVGVEQIRIARGGK